MAVKCTNCGGAHPSWDCRKPTKSNSPNKASEKPKAHGSSPCKAQGKSIGQQPTVQLVTAGETATPPKPKMGRPRTGYIKAEYNRKYMQDKRKADKLGITVKELREKEK